MIVPFALKKPVMQQVAKVFALCLLASTIWPEVSRAQHFSIGLGHHGWSHYDWHEDWHHPAYVYVPPPVVRDRIIYVQPAAQPAAAMPSAAMTPTSSRQALTFAAQRNPLPPYKGPGVTIINPAKGDVTLSFAVDDQVVLEIAPGESRALKDKGSYIVEYDRGGDFGTARMQLAEGTYEFGVTERGWKLFAVSNSSADRGKTAVKPNPLPITR